MNKVENSIEVNNQAPNQSVQIKTTRSVVHKRNSKLSYLEQEFFEKVSILMRPDLRSQTATMRQENQLLQERDDQIVQLQEHSNVEDVTENNAADDSNDVNNLRQQIRNLNRSLQNPDQQIAVM